MTPKISIIIPTYNKSLHLSLLLESILIQDFDPYQFEIVIVDDGSTDSTILVAQNFADRFKNYHYIYQINQGIGSARNSGLRHAKGELISFLADDYILDSSYLRKMGSIFFDDKVSGVRPLFSSLGKTPIEMAMHVYLVSEFKKYKAPVNQPIYAFPRSISWGGASMTRRSVFDKFGFFLEEFATCEDLEYGIRLWKSGIEMHIYDEELFKIKHRSIFFEANKRVYQYGFYGSQLAKFLKTNKSFSAELNPAVRKPPFLIRLFRLMGRPTLDTIKYSENRQELMSIILFGYCLLVSSILGTLHGKLSSLKH
jgi:glycosyltransferase involved in cell wall biosynthesis